MTRFRIFTIIIFACSVVIAEFPAQSKDDCFVCHDDEEFTTEIDGKEISLNINPAKFIKSVHKKLDCVNCHIGYDPEEEPHNENANKVNCLKCHQKTKQKHLFHPQILKANGIEYTPGINCTSCHGNHYVQSPKQQGSKWNHKNLVNSCGNCHEDIATAFKRSDHFYAVEKELEFTPSCIGCHKNPIAKIHSPEDSLNVKISQEKLCLSCHLEDPNVQHIATEEISQSFIESYEKSVHGSALYGGNSKAANCVDCHTSHNVLRKLEPFSTIYKGNIPKTCSKCHQEITNEFNHSIHGTAITKGIFDAPVCTDCHGEHNILKHDDPKSPVAFENVSAEVCSPCHSSVKLNEKFGISANKYKTFSDSYHGLALRGGSVEVANCVSCHGAHNIKPSTDSTSTISKTNLIKTCGSCHPGANKNFTVGKIHVDIKDKEEQPILSLIASIYMVLIISIVGFMFLHNLVDLYRKSKIKKLKQRGLIKDTHHYGHKLYLRMNLNERIQHILLAGSFILLVITGFMLRFPHTWWVSHISSLSNDAFEYRSLIHRIAAVVMVAVSVYHIFYIAFTVRGRRLIKDLFPKWRDVLDAIGIAKFNLGISKEKPKLDRFSYIEKAEYWALVWGTILMTVTGFIMWFENIFIGLFTKLGWDIANVIHFYEAWLAALAILVWHFYFVIFNPDVYPMSVAWFKGTITEEEMAEEHPMELERLKKEEEGAK
ncbi:cytochrome b/b6 domain-containing protein [Bacteroidota bacterium]